MVRVAAVVVALALGAVTGVAQTPDQLAIVKRLGPDGFAGAPSLGVLVEASAGVLVGRIVGTDGFELRDVDSPYSDRRGPFGYVSYRIAVDEVLVRRDATGSPRLAPGTVVRLEQRAKGDTALRFFSGPHPVAAGDTCLLFLAAEPRGVTLLGWSVQFRRASGSPPTAETLGAASLAAEMAKPGWFGAPIRMVDTPRGSVPEWESLLAEVRRRGPGMLQRLPGGEPASLVPAGWARDSFSAFPRAISSRTRVSPSSPAWNRTPGCETCRGFQAEQVVNAEPMMGANGLDQGLAVPDRSGRGRGRNTHRGPPPPLVARRA